MTVRLDINEIDVTSYILDKSMSVSMNKLQVTLVNYTAPVLDDGVLLTDWVVYGTWSGYIRGLSLVNYTDANKTPYLVITAENDDVLADIGSSASDFDEGPPANYKDLDVKRTWNNGTEEVRATLTTFDPWWRPGMNTKIQDTAHDLTGGVGGDEWTVMDTEETWPTSVFQSGEYGVPEYKVDLGLGDFATATTGAADGGPLSPPTLKGEVGAVATTTIEAAFTTPALTFGPAAEGASSGLIRADATIDLSGSLPDVGSKLFLYATQR